MAFTHKRILSQKVPQSLNYYISSIAKYGINVAIATIASKLCPPLTYSKIGETFGISKQRVEQLVRAHAQEGEL